MCIITVVLLVIHFIVLPVVPVPTSSGHPPSEFVTKTGTGTAAPLVLWAGNLMTPEMHVVKEKSS